MTGPPSPLNSEKVGRFRLTEANRALPHSLEAEIGILGSMIVEPQSAIPLVQESIDVEFFYVPAHRTIYEGILDLFSESVRVDLVTLTEHLRTVGRLDSVGGPPFVTSLFTFVPSAANISYYLEIVREKRILREIITTSAETVRRAYEEQDNVEGLLHRVEELPRALNRLKPPDLVAQPLIALARVECDPAMTLLGNRFLCRGSGMLFVGPSGIGKSSASVQQDVLWALGRPAFDIVPARPLRILCVQAENDAGDLGEMVRGICSGLGLTNADQEAVMDRIHYATESCLVGTQFLRSVVTPLLAKYRPDILRLDPLLAYIGGDVSDQTITSAFLRQGLNPLLTEFSCAVIINHHTPKIINRDTSSWRSSDWMYAGAGSADVTNWSRAAVVIDPTHAPRVFKIIAAKRGSRIGWADENGTPTLERLFSHASGSICWHKATAEEKAEVESLKPGGAKGKAKTKEDLMALVPRTGRISKNALISKAQGSGIGVHRARGFLDELIGDRELFTLTVPRPRTNPEVHVTRSEPVVLG